jgi:AhpD family alkylhydroperoxidase
MPRVAEKNNMLVRASNWYTKRTYGRAITTTSVIAHSPWNTLGWSMLELGHDRAGKVEERLKALAEVKAATVVGCQFCIDIGSALGRKAGVTEEQLRDFHRYRESDAFSEREKLAMEYAEAMCQTHVEVPDDLIARLRKHFDDAQLVELTASIAIENFRARFNNALDVTPAGFSEGAYCPMPDKLAREQDAKGQAAPPDEDQKEAAAAERTPA